MFRSASHVYSPKKSYFATRQLYHFVRPGSQRIAAQTAALGITVSAFRDATTDSLVIVGVKEGGANRVEVVLQEGDGPPTSWDLYTTTRTVNCVKTAVVRVQGGVAQIDLPDEAVFTLVGTRNKSN